MDRLLLCVCLLLTACNSVVSPAGTDFEPVFHSPAGAGGFGDGGSGNGSDSDEIVASTLVAGPTQIRLLSGAEYGRSVEDVLGVPSKALTHSDRGTGFDSGASGRIDEALLWTLLTEAERIGRVYFGERLSEDFPCAGSTPLGNDCLAAVVRGLGHRLFRRPLSDSEVSDRVDAAQGDPEYAVTQMLLSPRFLYRTEIGILSDPAQPPALDSYDRAALVAYALTGSTPDDELLEAAADGPFGPDEIRAQSRRLMQTSRGRERLVELIKFWLRADVLDSMSEFPQYFEKFSDGELPEALHAEFSRFVERVVFDEQGTLAELLASDQIPISEDTAWLYGIDASENFAAVPGRRGIVTLASVMAALSSEVVADIDSPVQRGLMISEQLLCNTIGFPSGLNLQDAVDEADIDNEVFESWTTREQFEALMEQGPACSSCHAQFMPVGFVLGGYNALGQEVSSKGERPIEVAVDNVSLGGSITDLENPESLVSFLETDPKVTQCFSEKVVAFVTGLNGGAFEAGLASAIGKGEAPKEFGILRHIEELLANPKLYERESGG